MNKKKIDDGGEAFGHGAENGHCSGMSLRDWFAGMAMMGIIANPESCYETCPELAKLLYQKADEMIAEKRRTEGGMQEND